MVRKRVVGRLDELKLRSLDEYHELLEREPKEKTGLALILGVTISRFFREAHVYEYLAHQVWPSWKDRTRVRMFSAGCACGEEPYSLAIQWREHGPDGVIADILAMEMDIQCLRRAREGIYTPGSLKEIPQHLIDRYFQPGRGNTFILSPEIIKMVHFHRADFREMGPPPDLDLAFCRNMAYTYFGPGARDSASKALAGAVKPGGYLVVGAKEKPDLNNFFEWVYPCVYRRTTNCQP